MLNISKFISENVTFRKESLFKADIENNKEQISREVEGKSLCVIGGAGSIGSSFIKAILPFKPSKLVVIDLNENGLAELHSATCVPPMECTFPRSTVHIH